MKKTPIAAALLLVSGTALAVTVTFNNENFTLTSHSIDPVTGAITIQAAPTGTTPPPAPSGYQLTVNAGGGGSVTGQGISCPSDCSEQFTAGTSVALTATALSGYIFSGWSGACTGTGACQVVMNSAQTVGASFTQQAATIPGQCPATDAEIITIDTLLNQQSTRYSLGTSDAKSFRVKTGNVGQSGYITTAKTTTNPAQRLVTVTSCPGDFNRSAIPASCMHTAEEVTSIYYTVGGNKGCVLQPNTTYYVNVTNQAVSPRAITTGTSTPSCPENNCPFSYASN